MDWFDLLAVQGTLRSLLQHHNSKTWILWCSAFCMVQLSHLYMITGKTIAFNIWTFVGKMMSLLVITLSRLVIAFLPRGNHQRSGCILNKWGTSEPHWPWDHNCLGPRGARASQLPVCVHTSPGGLGKMQTPSQSFSGVMLVLVPGRSLRWAWRGLTCLGPSRLPWSRGRCGSLGRCWYSAPGCPHLCASPPLPSVLDYSDFTSFPCIHTIRHSEVESSLTSKKKQQQQEQIKGRKYSRAFAW